jgi:hypothetical protein
MTTRKRAKPKLKAIPTFRSEDEEREFWATHDTVDYLDWSQARWVTFPNLKPEDPRQPPGRALSVAAHGLSGRTAALRAGHRDGGDGQAATAESAVAKVPRVRGSGKRWSEPSS